MVGVYGVDNTFCNTLQSNRLYMGPQDVVATLSYMHTV